MGHLTNIKINEAGLKQLENEARKNYAKSLHNTCPVCGKPLDQSNNPEGTVAVHIECMDQD